MPKRGGVPIYSDLTQLGEVDGYRSGFVFGGVWFIIFLGSILVQAPWAAFHGIVLFVVGSLILLFPPIVKNPRLWWILATLFTIGASFVFLPADWFEPKVWRQELGAIGVDTGDSVVIQWQFALEGLVLFVVILFTGLWMAGHRASPPGLRLWSLLFTCGVATYAVASWLVISFSEIKTDSYGFFPNRNHTATYLSMGSICGLGCVLQGIRDKRFVSMGIALFATAICLGAAGAWSISRAGILLIGIGVVMWLSLLGKRYLGRNGIWAVCLLLISAAGMFLIFDNTVKQRIADTFQKTEFLMEGGRDDVDPDQLSAVDLDFRIPTALDTFALIGDYKWTGVGAGQYYYVFPQYRHLTSVASNADNHHPESDWLWMASEAGIPATLCLALIVLLGLVKSLKSIRHGRDRALRSACLVAAAIVPFHGIFDVPGHRITLALSAFLLYSLSLGSISEKSVPIIPRKFPYRLAGIGVLAIAFLLLSSQWFEKPKLATVAAATAVEEATRLYRKDKALQEAAAAANIEYQPDPAEDLLEKAIVILQDASLQVPLDRQIPKYLAFIAFHFDDKQDLIDNAYTLERALDPTWVERPFEQGIAWAERDAARVAPLWEEALRRAERVGAIDPGQPETPENDLGENEWFSQKVAQPSKRLSMCYSTRRRPVATDMPTATSEGNPPPIWDVSENDRDQF